MPDAPLRPDMDEFPEHLRAGNKSPVGVLLIIVAFCGAAVWFAPTLWRMVGW